MNHYKKIIFAISAILVMSSCLKEEPTFLSEESAYANLTNAKSTLGGVYEAVAGYRYMGNDFLYLTYGNSGFYVSGIKNSNTATDNVFLCSLKPQPSATYNENTWQRLYISIDRANAFINNVPIVSDSAVADIAEWNDLIGEAYFLRAYGYFNLVRLWGEVPLRIEPTTMNNIHKAKSKTDVIYTQILNDIDMAKKLMFDVSSQRIGYPAAEAASMLEAKVYMQMATTEDDVPQTGENFWQKAYDAAKVVYGKYSLVNNYESLWLEDENNNTSESIFEVQYNDVAHSNYVKLFTAAKATKGNSWGRLRMNAELYDNHLETYPNDSIRMRSTFKTGFVNQKTHKYTKCYPETTKRNKMANAFNYLHKYWEKNIENMTSFNFQNFLVYRYADLLLMLAEISNELQNGEQYGYVEEVLDRVGLTPQEEYNGGQEAFRRAVMYEYRYELLGEAHDWFNNRRRGYEWFNNEVIIPHNTYVNFNDNVDVTLYDDRNTVMHLPTPTSEINTNDEVDD